MTNASSGELVSITVTGNTQNLTVDLPATVAGVNYTFYRATSTTSVDVRIKPVAGDKFQGKGITSNTGDGKAYVSLGFIRSSGPTSLPRNVIDS